jgi:hypothetical protein
MMHDSHAKTIILKVSSEVLFNSIIISLIIRNKTKLRICLGWLLQKASLFAVASCILYKASKKGGGRVHMADPVFIKTKELYRVKEVSDYLDVAFSRNWNTIPLAMDFFTDFARTRMDECEETYKVGTAVSELLENAVKYSHKPGIRIILNKKRKDNTINLKVYNFAERKHAKRLIGRIKEINERDSLSFYLERMRESVKNKEESAGLGLARVYHETEAIMSVRYFRLKKLVEVSATITLQNEED